MRGLLSELKYSRNREEDLEHSHRNMKLEMCCIWGTSNVLWQFTPVVWSVTTKCCIAMVFLERRLPQALFSALEGGARYLLNMWRSTGAAVCSVTFFFPRVCHRCRTSGTGNLCRTEPHKRGLAHMQMLARRPNHKVTQIHPNINMNSGSRENSSAAVQRVWWFRSFSEGKVALSCRNLERSLGDTSDSAAAHFHCFPLPVLFSFLMDKPRIHKDVFFFFFVHGSNTPDIFIYPAIFTPPRTGLHIKVTGALRLTLKRWRNLKRTKIDDITVIS